MKNECNDARFSCLWMVVERKGDSFTSVVLRKSLNRVYGVRSNNLVCLVLSTRRKKNVRYLSHYANIYSICYEGSAYEDFRMSLIRRASPPSEGFFSTIFSTSWSVTSG